MGTNMAHSIMRHEESGFWKFSTEEGNESIPTNIEKGYNDMCNFVCRSLYLSLRAVVKKMTIAIIAEKNT